MKEEKQVTRSFLPGGKGKAWVDARNFRGKNRRASKKRGTNVKRHPGPSHVTAPDGRPWTFVRRVTNRILDHCSDPKPKKKESDDVCSDANDTLEILDKLYFGL
ncbi:hypothetical protein PHJA_000841100 [Phtheirospermum japonicum]|uniref:Uncharacterized protein n=1 Tax=Phtheirospermum japonicum TaxID=374723 RepID=A0A830BSG2_9LAMI|nr:hypothetical protein PHJA_000841100 [Phtheirospermum japonicum]